MAVVVVGGHTRNIGKTSVVAGLIAALPERHWTAFKVTQFGHGMCSANGEPCDCETAERGSVRGDATHSQRDRPRGKCHHRVEQYSAIPAARFVFERARPADG